MMNVRPSSLLFAVAIALSSVSPAAEDGSTAPTGLDIYVNQCVRCHGAKGEGVADKHDEPLYGDRSIESLAKLIHRTMPEDKDEKCSPEDSQKVAAYIFDAFYSPEARSRIAPLRIQLSRLTIRQFQNSVADLVGSFRPETRIGRARGLNAQYYNARNFRNEKKSLERVDAQINFDFAQGSPEPIEIGADEFSIRWRGTVIAEETGQYEFGLRTENGARLWINDDRKTLIDAWVSSGRDKREHRETVFLLGGRAYPIRVEFFKYKELSASLVLEWRPPHKVWEPIPQRNLSPSNAPERMVVATAFPPDDSSLGYERGSAVSKAWDRAATFAAVEVANHVIERIEALAQTKADAPDRAERLKLFCERFAERAFRRPLSSEQKSFFIESQFAGAPDLEKAVKRVALLVLKSPRFLYPDLGAGQFDDYTVASRLALGLWDSLPDEALLKAAAAGELKTESQVARHAVRMVQDPRAKSKVRNFFHHWLEMEEGEDLSKDTGAFPDFSDAVLADLRTSLDLFLEEVVWGEASDFRQLLRADYLILNPRLARFYGREAFADGEFQRVAFDPKQRAGVLTHPYLLSTFAYHKSSSPIHRGVFLTRNVLGRSLKPPPMAIEFMDNRFDPSLTMREKVAELTRPVACQGCHSVINPLGFSLEHYDAVGRFRTIDNEKRIDATSDYTTADGQIVRLTGARDLAEYAAGSDDAHRGFVRQLFQQLIQQPPFAYGPNTLNDLRRSFADSNYHIRKLIVKIATLSALHHPPETKDHPDE
jgi:cytochrome c5